MVSRITISITENKIRNQCGLRITLITTLAIERTDIPVRKKKKETRKFQIIIDHHQVLISHQWKVPFSFKDAAC